jgi:Ni/Co efflux regulator RcnB
MGRRFLLAVILAGSVVVGGTAHAEEPRGDAHPAAAPRGEPHPTTRSYQRISEPKGWNTRPATVNRTTYQHNYQAARSFRIGPYHPPAGWSEQRWAYGQILPRAYWAGEYIIADYWLFGLEVPPAGYEWVRDSADAILVNVTTGEILQVEYSVFA